VVVGALGLYREASSTSVAHADKVSFVPQPRTSPGVAELDPRVEEEPAPTAAGL
jgi:hypothetical protein